MSASANAAGAYARRRATTLAKRYIAVLLAALGGTVAVLVADLPLLLAVVLNLALLAVVVFVDRYRVPVVERWARGARGEEAVGASLDGIGGEWFALHDVDLGRGNVDHLVVGPGGVFAIETKTWSGFFDPARHDGSWWRQAYRQAKSLERLIDHPVVPIVVVDGGYTRRLVQRQRGVVVVPHRFLVRHLLGWDHTMSSTDATAVLQRAAALTARRTR